MAESTGELGAAGANTNVDVHDLQVPCISEVLNHGLEFIKLQLVMDQLAVVVVLGNVWATSKEDCLQWSNFTPLLVDNLSPPLLSLLLRLGLSQGSRVVEGGNPLCVT